MSVTLPEGDVAALDDYARAAGLKSRSAAVRRAIRLLRQRALEQDYAAAWDEWESSGDQHAFGATAPTDSSMLRGEIRLIDLEPARGSESNKRRPAVIVSNDRANAAAERRGRGVVTVVPVTSKVSRIFAFQTLLPAKATQLPVDSKAQAEQVRSVAVERVGPVVGRLPSQLMTNLDDALRLHLQL